MDEFEELLFLFVSENRDKLKVWDYGIYNDYDLVLVAETKRTLLGWEAKLKVNDEYKKTSSSEWVPVPLEDLLAFIYKNKGE